MNSTRISHRQTRPQIWERDHEVMTPAKVGMGGEDRRNTIDTGGDHGKLQNRELDFLLWVWHVQKPTSFPADW
jgi:hypothetical protein